MFTFILTILFIYGHIELVTAKVCMSNEEYVACGMAISCQPTCAKPNGTVCPSMVCSQGCRCKNSFVRVSDTNTTCVIKDQCNVINTKSSTCGSNEVPAGSCGSISSCQPSCENPKGTVCPDICEPNSCNCKNGFVRDNSNNLQCIPQTKCQIYTSTIPTSTCGDNEEINGSCAPSPSCQPTCQESSRTVCSRLCSIHQCVCKKGFIRDVSNNYKCIKESRCQNGK
ncbi:unnamed protein product [Adineta steineri]|uniref:TIL domain-containing protein n=1 Tax=Adineta steineri TaxID=433720 RepID=A0A815ANX6_9BILA|nr:unnamed protein product [Adineta steineri]CAF3833450.1 unnamed protein product [Adineta steineri]